MIELPTTVTPTPDYVLGIDDGQLVRVPVGMNKAGNTRTTDRGLVVGTVSAGADNGGTGTGSGTSVTVIDDLVTADAVSALSANQGVVLKGLVDTNTSAIATKAADTTVVHLTGNETVAGIKTFSSAPVVPNASFANAALANMAASTVKANTTGGSAAPSDITLTALATALGVTAGGLGQFRSVKRTASLATVPINSVRIESTRITIPGGILGTHGMLRLTFEGGKSGTVDQITPTIHIGSISGSTNQVDLFNFTTTQQNFVGELIIVGNGTDQLTVKILNPQAATATGTASSANTITFPVNTAANWDLILAFNTAANETATATYMGASVYNPDLASYTATFANIGGVATDNAGLVSYISGQVDPGVSVEAAGRTLTQADNGKTLEYTGAGAGSFVVPNTLTAPFSCELVQWSTGVPTFTSDGTSVIRVPTGKSASVASQYDGVAAQLISTGPVTVRVV